MRVALVTLVMVALLPALVPAQSRIPAPRVSGPLPSIGLPLPRITAPLPSIGLPPITDTQRAAVGRQAPAVDGGRRPHRRRGSRTAGTAVLVVPVWGWDHRAIAQAATPTPSYQAPSAAAARAQRATGTLSLDVEPFALVQVYVDGYFVGTPPDVGGNFEMEAGAHRVELRAAGYQSISFDVRITAGRSVTYRHSLEPLPPAETPRLPVETAPAAQAQRSIVYLIPGCYLGNVPPKDAGLPATCDQSQVTTFEP